MRVDLRAPGRVAVDGYELVIAAAQWRIVAALALRPSGLTVDELLEVSRVISVGSMRTLITGIRRQLEQYGVDGTSMLRFGQGRYRLQGVTTDFEEESEAIERAASLIPTWPSVVAELRPIAKMLTTTVSVALLDENDPVRSAHWEVRRLDGLAMLVEGELRAGSAAAALALLEGIEIPDFDERFGLLTAVALYKLGRQRQALLRIACVRQALLEEFGQPPTREAQELEMAILRQDLHLAGWPDTDLIGKSETPPLPLPITVATQHPIHGRAEEFAAIDRAASSGRVCLMRISGPPGIGKSSLTAHWAAARHTAGATVLWARAGAGQHEYGVFEQLTDQLLGPVDIEYRSGLEAADALLAGLRPIHDAVIVIDRVDEMSPGETQALSLLLGGRGARGPLTVLAETAASAGGPFTELFVRESARGAAQTVEVGPLDVASVTSLVLSSTKARDTNALRVLARELFESSGGNPLYVLLAIEGGQRAPESMTDLLDLTIGAVGPATLEVLEMAAVLGRGFNVSELATAFKRPVEALTDTLADAGRNGLVVETNLGEYRIVHEPLRRRILARMGPTRVAVLHAKVSSALADLQDRTSLLVHSVRALPITGDRRSIKAAVDHARALIEAGQYREALRLATASSQGADEWPPTTDSEMVSVLAVHASALEHHGDREGAKALHDRAWTLALRTDSDADLIAAARAIGVAGESVIPNPEHAYRLSAALERCATPSDRSSLALRVAQLALNSGQVDRVRALLNKAGTTTQLATHTRLLLGRQVLDESPDLNARLSLSSEAAQRAEDVGDMEALAIATAYRSSDLFASGNLAAAFNSWNDEDRIAIERPTPKERWFAAARRCFVSQLANDAEQSMAYADAALNLGLDLGYVDARSAYGAQVFCISARHGGLVALVDALEQEARTPGAPAAWQLGLACAVLESGDLPGAAQLLLDGLAALNSTPGRFAAAGWLLAGRILISLPNPPQVAMETVCTALAPWTGTFGVVGTSVGYLGPVDAILEPLASRLGDARVSEFAANAQRLSALLKARSRV